MEPKIAAKYRITRKIAEGSNRSIYLGSNTQTNEEVAIILEHQQKESNIFFESRIYRVLQEGMGIPKLLWSGNESGFNVIVLELLGPNLKHLLAYCRHTFSLKTVLLLAEQLISRIEFMHSYYYLHRNVSPKNFLIGIGKKAQVIHMLGFDLSKKYIEKYNQHIAYKEGKKVIGSAKFGSLNSLYGIEQSRRDDLEALGYMLVYFIKGRLPWQGLKADRKEEKYKSVFQMKRSLRLENLCEGIPGEFQIYLNYCRGLRFEEKPDYSYLRRIFKELMVRENLGNDMVFDWCLPKKEMIKDRK
jgi:casein kinase 1